MLLGEEALGRLGECRVAVFGVGGVGGTCVEALARSGVGAIDVIDNDVVDVTNLNRQILATHRTIGRYKTDAAEDRILEINPDAHVTKHRCFYLPENASLFDFSVYDYVVDAIDTVTAKIDIILRARAEGVPVISSMGTGNKLDPSRLTVTDLFRTENDPLAKVMRRELRRRGVTELKVVWTDEPARTPLFRLSGEQDGEDRRKKRIPGSTAFVPPAAGLMLAAEVIRDLANIR